VQPVLSVFVGAKPHAVAWIADNLRLQRLDLRVIDLYNRVL
jgi:hypothetical protein